jgi:glycosyltransferase involved in cell wall biosynthesis
VSFGDSKSEREMLAMQTIRRLHPQYERDVQTFVQRDPARQARLILDLARLTSDDRLTILNVIHNRAGGSLRHLDDLAKALSNRVQFLTLIPLNGGVNLRLHGQAESFVLQWPSLDDAPWNHLVHTLRSLRVSHVHYHHLLGHQPKIALLHEALQISHDFTAHDYYSFCPQISLTDENDRYCGESGLDQCARCVQKRPAPDGLSIIEWRARSSVFLQSARHVITPSPDTWKRMHQFTPQAHVVLAPHSDLVPSRMVPDPKPNKLSTERPMKVVLLGGLSKIKGADTLEAVASLAAKQALPIEFHLLGFGYRSLRTQPRAALTVHGAYDDRDLPALLKWLEPDLAWFPAQCPETYSYTLSACLEAGLPVMASDLGALPDRLHSRPWTWLIDWQASPQEWLEHLLLARNHLESALKPKDSAPIPNEHIEHFGYESQYLLSLKQQPRVNQPSEILQELQGFIMGSNSSPVQQSLPLKTLFWLRGLRLLAPLARMIPTHLQRRIKSMLLG